MKNVFITITLFSVVFAGCGSGNNGSNRLPAMSKNNSSADPGVDGTADDPTTQNFPTPADTGATTKQGGPGAGKKAGNGPGGSGGGGGAQNCNAVFEDGYWKTWAKNQTKPALPPSGPAPVDACKVTTSSDTTGGSTNGQPAGNQRVLLKTSEGCYVPNGGGPVGPLLGACTGLTWRVPY